MIELLNEDEQLSLSNVEGRKRLVRKLNELIEQVNALSPEDIEGQKLGVVEDDS